MIYTDIKNGRFYNEDCFNAMREIPDGVIDMVLCDLPYGTTVSKWDIILPFDKMWAEYSRICKSNAAIVLFGAEPFSSKLRLSNLDNFKYDWYWHKNKPTGGATSSKQPMRCFETISVFYKEQCVYNPLMTVRTETELKKLSKNSLTKCDSDLYGLDGYTQIRENLKEKYPTNYLNNKTVHSRDKIKTSHPNQKPVDLCEYLIKTYTNENELILDNTAGSGTTAIAAINTNRKWVCMEKEIKYYNEAIERITNHAH